MNLVTGGSGFIGQYLVRELSQRGERVRVLARTPRPPATLEDLPGVEYVPGDITDRTAVADACRGASRVYHLAACGHVSALSSAAYAEFVRVNVEGTRNVLLACYRHGVASLVHVSSTAAMGLIEKQGRVTEDDPPRPVTPYQKSKWASESLAIGLGRALDVSTVVIRPCMTYGVGGKGEFYKQALLMRRGLFPKVGLGRNLTPLVHVRDVVKGALLAAERGRPGQVYLIASERSLPLDEMRQLVMQAWGRRAIYPFVPTAVMYAIAHGFEGWSKLTGRAPLATRQNIASTVWDREFSIEKSRRELGYAPSVGFAQGIAETIAWFKVVDA